MERMILCFIEDDFGARQAREIGTDRICIETDYPHSDAIWPNAPERMMEAFAPTDLTDDEINQMTHLNAMRFFQYDPFKIRPAREVHRRRAAGRSGRPRHLDRGEGSPGRARRAHEGRRVRRDLAAAMATSDRPRSAQPQVLGRRRRRVPGRARRRPDAAPAGVGRVPRARVGAAACSATSPAATCSSSAAAPRSGRSRSAALGARAGRPRRLARAARVTPAGVGVAAARSPPTPSSCRSPTPRSTSCSATTARSSFCDPARARARGRPRAAARRAARVLRATPAALPHVERRTSEQQTRRLHRDLRRARACIDFDEGTVDWVLPPGEWIRVLRAHGFEIEDLIELRPPADATTTYDFAPLEWARRWPAEWIWKARRAAGRQPDSRNDLATASSTAVAELDCTLMS